MMGEEFKACDAYIELRTRDERESSGADSLPKGRRIRTMKDLDRVYQFILNSSVFDDGSSPIELQAIRQKIDWRILPILILCYTMQFIDKVLLNVSWISQERDLICSTDLIAYLVRRCHGHAQPSQTPWKQHL